MNTDSRDYFVLENAVKNIKDIEGLTCEIGVREGGSTKLILETLKKTNQSKIHIAIDPFGNIEYRHWETAVHRLDYTNSMKNKMLMHLYSYCHENKMEVLFFPMEDTEFFKRFSDGIPVYNEYKQIINDYSLVFFDGPHTTELVKNEFDFFKNKIVKYGYIVFDDIDQYPHMLNLDRYITENGFEKVQQTLCKISYIKI